MTNKIRILTSSVTNPWFNLATEDWIFRELQADTHVLFLWRNSPTVVIGANQNPWVECNLDKMQADNIFLARRQSGGGAVFHDLGNTNFTFLSPIDNYNPQANFEIIIQALSKLGISAEVKGRNDLVVEDKKISGSAFKQAKDRAFHHGTLLINADMAKLADYLNPHPLKLEAKGIKSVKARVANMTEFNPKIDHALVCNAIIHSFCKHYSKDLATIQIEDLDKNFLKNQAGLNSFYQKMADWDWRFGKSPQFSHQTQTRFDWGIVDLRLDVQQGKITNLALFSDALDINFISELKQCLLYKIYKREEITTSLESLGAQNPSWQSQIDQVKIWLSANIQN